MAIVGSKPVAYMTVSELMEAVIEAIRLEKSMPLPVTNPPTGKPTPGDLAPGEAPAVPPMLPPDWLDAKGKRIKWSLSDLVDMFPSEFLTICTNYTKEQILSLYRTMGPNLMMKASQDLVGRPILMPDWK